MPCYHEANLFSSESAYFNLEGGSGLEISFTLDISNTEAKAHNIKKEKVNIF